MPRSESNGSDVDQKPRARKIAKVLARAYSNAVCALHHDGPFQLLAATILSAQCTDERVNAVTPRLFARFPSPAKLAQASQAEVEEIIRSLGFFRAKSTNLRGMAQNLVANFGGQVPQTLDELVTLSGVGRKTANVVLGVAYGVAVGVVVDTHVRRISYLLGLTGSKLPERIETDLMHLLPRSEWIDFSHRLIHHGRRVCVARRPRCTDCPLLALCPRVGLPPL